MMLGELEHILLSLGESCFPVLSQRSGGPASAHIWVVWLASMDTWLSFSNSLEVTRPVLAWHCPGPGVSPGPFHHLKSLSLLTDPFRREAGEGGG